jgi:hypothetical protein
MHWIYIFGIPVTFDNCAESAWSVCVGKKQSMDTFSAIFNWKIPL